MNKDVESTGVVGGREREREKGREDLMTIKKWQQVEREGGGRRERERGNTRERAQDPHYNRSLCV